MSHHNLFPRWAIPPKTAGQMWQPDGSWPSASTRWPRLWRETNSDCCSCASLSNRNTRLITWSLWAPPEECRPARCLAWARVCRSRWGWKACSPSGSDGAPPVMMGCLPTLSMPLSPECLHWTWHGCKVLSLKNLLPWRRRKVVKEGDKKGNWKVNLRRCQSLPPALCSRSRWRESLLTLQRKREGSRRKSCKVKEKL